MALAVADAVVAASAVVAAASVVVVVTSVAVAAGAADVVVLVAEAVVTVAVGVASRERRPLSKVTLRQSVGLFVIGFREIGTPSRSCGL
jgi:hypothetical protein